MRASTHEMSYIFIMLIIIKYMGLQVGIELGIAAISGLIGSTLPDAIDLKIPFISKIFEHRGFIHSVWIPSIFIIAFFMSESGRLLDLSAFFFGIGWLTHIVGDSLTPKGIMPFTPLSKIKFAPAFLRKIPTGSFQEEIFQFIIAVGIAFFVASGM